MVFAGRVTPSVALILSYKNLCSYISRFRDSRDVTVNFFDMTVVKPEFSNNISGVTFLCGYSFSKAFPPEDTRKFQSS